MRTILYIVPDQNDGWWELDANGDLQPRLALVGTSKWELDANGDLQPKQYSDSVRARTAAHNVTGRASTHNVGVEFPS